MQPLKILLGVSGTVASKLTSKLVNQFKEIGSVKIVLTKNSRKFIDDHESIVTSIGSVNCYTDEDEWSTWSRNKTVLHIDLRRWADVIVIISSMNTLAKMANGFCDNLLTSIVRAWECHKPLILAPAANTTMYNNVITSEHINKLHECFSSLNVVYPVEKELACGDVGIGALAETETIIACVKSQFLWSFPVHNHSLKGNKKFIPTGDHPGAFGAKRKYDYHTGVDIYLNDKVNIYAVEDGKVVGLGQFTGEKVGSPWWQNTNYALVEGFSGVVNYGEIDGSNYGRRLHVGDFISCGQLIGCSKSVLPFHKKRDDIPNHSTCMLHVELYSHGTTLPVSWHHDETKPDNLLDPTELLNTATYCKGYA